MNSKDKKPRLYLCPICEASIETDEKEEGIKFIRIHNAFHNKK